MTNTQPEFSSSNDLDYIREAFRILVQGAPKVAESLLHVAVHGKSELARVQAGTTVFDRIGMHAKLDIGLSAATLFTGTEGPVATGAVDTVKARLAQLRAQQIRAEIEEGTDPTGVVLQFPHIIEGEVDADD